MPILKTEAIVLRSYKWSETSNIVTLCSRDFGKLRAVAKGARRPNSRFDNCLNPITQSQILFYPRKSGGLDVLKEASSINYFPDLKQELEKLAYASALCELTEYLTPDGQTGSSAYYALHQTLNKMEDSPLEDFKKLLWHFELRMFAVAGYRPQLCECVCCGGSPKSLPVSFSLAQGGVLCEKCEQKDAARRQVHPDTVKLLRMLQSIEIEKVGKIQISPSLEREIKAILEAFWRYHTEEYRKLKSLQVLRQISRNAGT